MCLAYVLQVSSLPFRKCFVGFLLAATKKLKWLLGHHRQLGVAHVSCQNTQQKYFGQILQAAVEAEIAVVTDISSGRSLDLGRGFRQEPHTYLCKRRKTQNAQLPVPEWKVGFPSLPNEHI